jgi:hypothetical protein
MTGARDGKVTRRKVETVAPERAAFTSEDECYRAPSSLESRYWRLRRL